MSSLVEIYGCDDSYWCVHGEGAGDQGIYISEDGVEGIVDAPVETEWRSSAFQVGGSYKHTKWLYRDVNLEFLVVPDVDVLEIESDFRKAFDYRVDPWDDSARMARIDWSTDMSGTRSLDVLLAEAPDLPMARDFETDGYIRSILALRAGQPMWYSPDHVEVVEVGAGTHDVTVTMSNPTDQPCFQRWVLSAGATYTLPDFSWRGKRGARVPGGEFATRKVTPPKVTTAHQGAVLDLDPMQLDDRAAAGQNRLGMYNPPGSRLLHFIPPYTPETEVPVRIVADSGVRLELHMPRRWSRPWGLE